MPGKESTLLYKVFVSHPNLTILGHLLNPAGAGVSSHLPLAGGGGANIAPLPNFRTNRRSEEREAAIESSQREDSNTILKFS